MIEDSRTQHPLAKEKQDVVVFIVDDDEAVRESLSWLISSVGHTVKSFDSAQNFLKTFSPGTQGCVLVDVRMPGMSGLDLQRMLVRQPTCMPVIIITGHGDVQMAVRAMKDGAFDFVEKPFNDQVILDLVHGALEECHRRSAQKAEHMRVLNRMDTLTPREREVLELIIEGETNKEIAYALDISDKTVEAHRARVMEKLQARSLADLVKKITELGQYQGKP
ncbi:response regulator transcription factor [Varunaivibrio sulfuroxidans]|uniref:LuxR family two component transcriptional regulator n=1 Tax=Varunaivibrio sulfuroxidans TaxID=1773489 RepID=A0A4R3J7F5_9PROT|nr:response regulator [Varunaivibrio sulfuroxidans]TCS61357.1 LuxR family two component transcriptional regulator [Varunaivibrio sulfuroxidans]WES31031.1 response regulator [Varunaivibrio sulfuroxidans]